MSAAHHCEQCETYETTVMANTGPAPPEVEPCPDYEMTDAFRDWLVSRMRGEVLNQVNESGLDRMSILRIDGERDDED